MNFYYKCMLLHCSALCCAAEVVKRLHYLCFKRVLGLQKHCWFFKLHTWNMILFCILLSGNGLFEISNDTKIFHFWMIREFFSTLVVNTLSIFLKEISVGRFKRWYLVSAKWWRTAVPAKWIKIRIFCSIYWNIETK